MNWSGSCLKTSPQPGWREAESFLLVLQKRRSEQQLMTAITMWMNLSSSSISPTHMCTQECSFSLTTACCCFQLVDLTSDTGPQEALLIGWTYRNRCVKGNWGQTVHPGKRKAARDDRREGQREEPEADGHDLSGPETEIHLDGTKTQEATASVGAG